MPRTKTIASIDAEIAKKQELLAKVKNRYDAVAKELSALQEQKREIQSKEIMAAFIKSGKSYNEIMNFLDTKGDNSETVYLFHWSGQILGSSQIT